MTVNEAIKVLERFREQGAGDVDLLAMNEDGDFRRDVTFELDGADGGRVWIEVWTEVG